MLPIPERIPEPIVPEPLGSDAVDVSAPRLSGPVLMSQGWLDVTFLHWAVEPAEVARFMPPGIRPDTFEATSYVGLVAFRMVGAGIGRGPAVPRVGTFLETNVRLYSVDSTGRRGVVFLSLDADRALVVAGARVAFGLPYRWARMSHRHTVTSSGDQHEYDGRLRWPGVHGGTHIVVRVGEPRAAEPLDDFLVARWGLHSRHVGLNLFTPNQHQPWPLRSAELVDLRDDLIASVGLGDLASRPPDRVAFSDGVFARFALPTRSSRPHRAIP
ncbi:MAG: DUF2071 domain-containing protein [Sporichthyaceae bacterium]